MLYFLTINYFKFRVRTSQLASLALFNYSEFGLIVGGLAYKMGWMSSDILIALAVAVSLSFILAAPLSKMGHQIYLHSGKWLQEHAAEKLNQRDQLINPGHAQVLILGMGRIGTGAYDELHSRYGKICLGVEVRDDAAERHREEGAMSSQVTPPTPISGKGYSTPPM